MSERRLDDHAVERSKIQDKEGVTREKKANDLRRNADDIFKYILSDFNVQRESTLQLVLRL